MPGRIMATKVKEVCYNLKNVRASRAENVYNELWKKVTDNLYRILSNLFQKFLNRHEVPIESKTSHLSTEYRKTTRVNATNFEKYLLQAR